MNPSLVPLLHVVESPPHWLAPHRSRLRQLLSEPHPKAIADRLNAARAENSGTPRFVEHGALPKAEPYEAFIARTDCVPTRDNLHDFLNGLMWLSYPRSKRRMNELQSQEIRQHGASGTRGAVRDALTVLDENGALLQAPSELVQALRERDWQTLFVARRSLWECGHLVLFGHALIEKLLQPRKNITAHVWVLDEISDVAFAESLTRERLSTEALLPLPIFGVPGWWAGNEDPAFYDDMEVFRPMRRS